MKFKNCIFPIIAFFLVVLLFSCNKKKENNNESIQQEAEKTSIETEENRNIVSKKSYALDDETRESIRSKVTATEEEKEAMKEFIYKNEQRIIKYKAKIVYIEKANFGILGGDNWIVKLDEFGDMFILIYMINEDRIEKRYIGTVDGLNFMDQSLNEISEYDIMRDIPGTHIPDGVFSFGDFNGDGMVELFKYIYSYLVGYNIDIFHYDSQKNGFVFRRIPYKIIDPKNGPAPVKFITYQGMLGFKVYNEKYNSETETYEDGKWYFYTWDAEQREYIEIGEVVE